MTENGAVAAGEHSCHPPPFVADLWPPHCKDAPVHREEQALLDAVTDCVPPIPKRKKLISRDDPVLAPHQPPGFPRLVS
jgi:hypothetical protein